MMKYTDRNHRAADSMLLAAELARRSTHTPYRCALDAAKALELARIIAKHAEAACSVPTTPKATKRAENAAANLRALLGGEYGAHVLASGDPRGYVVRVWWPDMLPGVSAEHVSAHTDRMIGLA